MGARDPELWLVAIPLAAAVLAFLLRGAAATVANALALAGLVAAVGATIAALVAHGPRTFALGGWPPPLGIALGADAIGVYFIAVTGLVGAPISAYAFAYLAGKRGERAAFWPLWWLCWAGMNSLFLSRDLFNLYVSLEVLGLSAVALVSLAGREANVAAMRYVLVTLVGSLLYLLGVALIYAEVGAVDLDLASRAIAPGSLASVALPAMIAGLALKTALVPLHFWLPAAHAAAIAPASAILSALVVKASFYLALRLAALPAVEPAVVQALGGLGALAVLWGSVQALRQTRLKMLIAYSTVAQVGYLFLAIPLALDPQGGGALEGALLFVLAHAAAKAAMFLAAGAIANAVGSDRLDALGGLAVRMPVTLLAFGIAGVTLIGLPPSAGFSAKWLLLVAALRAGHPLLALVIVAGSLLAAAYVVLPVARALRAPAGDQVAPLPVPLVMQLAPLALALVGVGLGFASSVPLAWLAIGREAP
jgi:multicomponent Na+:H+ antiporter subunit D